MQDDFNALVLRELDSLRRINKSLEERLRQSERLREVYGNKIKGLQSMQAALVKKTHELNKLNSELSALHEVSSAIVHHKHLGGLCEDILMVLSDTIPLEAECESGIFQVESERMKLIAYRGRAASHGFIEAHQDMKVGDCLCGWVAQTGEIFISENCGEEIPKTIGYDSCRPHGHIIIPFKAQDRVVGVYFAYTLRNTHIDERKKRTFQAIGEQLGIAFEKAILYEEREFLSLHDPLTGLANRRYMGLVMSKELAHAKQAGHPFAVILADVDYFKKYNDEHGHLAGDELLSNIAKLILRELRSTDLAVRYGGEELLVLLPETSISQALEVAERIRHSIAISTRATISLGVASLGSSDSMTGEQLISKADVALYRAKRSGRNQAQLASD